MSLQENEKGESASLMSLCCHVQSADRVQPATHIYLLLITGVMDGQSFLFFVGHSLVSDERKISPTVGLSSLLITMKKKNAATLIKKLS